jgi:hypothetical protein
MVELRVFLHYFIHLHGTRTRSTKESRRRKIKRNKKEKKEKQRIKET